MYAWHPSSYSLLSIYLILIMLFVFEYFKLRTLRYHSCLLHMYTYASGHYNITNKLTSLHNTNKLWIILYCDVVLPPCYLCLSCCSKSCSIKLKSFVQEVIPGYSISSYFCCSFPISCVYIYPFQLRWQSRQEHYWSCNNIKMGLRVIFWSK